MRSLTLILLIFLSFSCKERDKEPEWKSEWSFDVIFSVSMDHRYVLNGDTKTNKKEAAKIQSLIDLIQSDKDNALRLILDSLFSDIKKEEFSIEFIEHPEHNDIYRFVLKSTTEKSCDEVLSNTIKQIELNYTEMMYSRFNNVEDEIDLKLDQLKIQLDSLQKEYNDENISDEKKKLLYDVLMSQEMMYSQYMEQKIEIKMKSVSFNRLFFHVDRKPRKIKKN